jgi:hypothetical protein
MKETIIFTVVAIVSGLAGHWLDVTYQNSLGVIFPIAACFTVTAVTGLIAFGCLFDLVANPKPRRRKVRKTRV